MYIHPDENKTLMMDTINKEAKHHSLSRGSYDDLDF